MGDKVENRCKACLPGSSIQGQGAFRTAPDSRTPVAAVLLAEDIAAGIAAYDTADMATVSRVAAPAAAPAESAIVEADTATGAAAAPMAAPTAASADAGGRAAAAPAVTLPVAAKAVRQQLGDSPEVSSSDTETSDDLGTSDDTGDDAPPATAAGVPQAAAVPSAVVAQSNTPGPDVTAPTKKAGGKRKAVGAGDKQGPKKQLKITMQALTGGKKGKP